MTNMSCSTTILQTGSPAGLPSFTSTWLCGNCRLTAARGEPDAENPFSSAVSKVQCSQ